MTRLLHEYDVISCGVYAYICSMVKDRGRTMNHHQLARDRTRAYMARDYGADGQHRTTSVPLATRF